MAKITISKKEIEDILKDYFSVSKIAWNKDGGCTIEKEADKLMKKIPFNYITVPNPYERLIRPYDPINPYKPIKKEPPYKWMPHTGKTVTSILKKG